MSGRMSNGLSVFKGERIGTAALIQIEVSISKKYKLVICIQEVQLLLIFTFHLSKYHTVAFLLFSFYSLVFDVEEHHYIHYALK